MRRALIAVPCAVSAALLAAAARPAAAPPGEILFRVTSAPDDAAPIEFEAHALGPDLRPSADVERAVTPYTLRVPGDEAYVLFRQHGGGPRSEFLRVTVSPAADRSTQVVSPVSMFVVRGSRAAATIVQPSDGRE